MSAHSPFDHDPPAAELPAHGYAITQRIPGSEIAVDIHFVLTRDEIYVPIAVRRPPGNGPFPAIMMGRGNGRGGVPHVLVQMKRLAAMQERMIARGYVLAYVNYRNEIPHLYEESGRAHNLPDDISGAARTLKSAPTLDSDDFIAILRYLETLPYVSRGAIGAVGVSHGGEIILKAAAETTFACGVAIEGASHEFLSVDTGSSAPREGSQLQYQDIDVVRRHADKQAAMERIRRIETPILHIGRDHDHLQGIFQLAHEWMREAGKDTAWASFDHPDHGYPFIYSSPDGGYRPNPVQQQAFDLFMKFFDERLKRSLKNR
ncbi:MAG TPA: prolyl oligopeptidase family serine peptidase [Burkholderiales bacterium]|nr:prolyl oligopeptidase family serine peptidase [Burkholderiales bacterium]